MTYEPLKATSYTVDRIVNAIASDANGNLILKDLLNSSGVTLTQLVRGLIASNVTFNNDGSFFTGVTNIQDALTQLNQFAYFTNSGRFIIVDPTISDSLTESGKIYNNIQTAVVFANSLLTNGYNTINILLMGSHLQDFSTEISNDLGVFEYNSSNIAEIVLNKNGIRLIGIGKPTIRFTDINTPKNLFVVGTTATQELSVIIQDISFEFVNCTGVSAIKVVNSPANTNIKDKNGLFIDGISASFIGGTNENNRVIDISNTTSPIKSNIKIKNFSMGSLASVTPSATPIELIYVHHDADTVVNIENMEFINLDQPNPTNVISIGNITSITGITVHAGKVFVNNAKLDEKMYWNNETFSLVKTRFIEATGLSELSLNNITVVRDDYNTSEENIGGITTINDWLVAGVNVKINSQGGFDEIFDVNIIPIETTTPAPSSIPSSGSPTSGSPTSDAPTTGSGFLYDVKPVKGFYNGAELAFGIGDKNELRLGIVDESNIATFQTFTNSYGIPFAINTTDKKIYFGINGVLHSIGGSNFGIQIESSDWELVGPNYEVIITHNLNLQNKYSFTVSAFNTSDIKVEPTVVTAIDTNSCKITMTTDDPIYITIFS